MKSGKIIEIFSEILFPRHCLGCRMNLGAGVICEPCLSGISTNNAFFCGECEARLPIALKICHPNVPCIMGAAGFYDDPVLKTLVHNLKFRNVREAAEPLAELMARYISSVIPGLARNPRLEIINSGKHGSRPGGRDDKANFLLLPIPLSKHRQYERGYNQAEEIAKKLAEKISLPLMADGLVKIKNSKPQSETKDLKERRENLQGCFAVPNPSAVAGRKILLIDDVTTSGTTFLEAASALKAAGAGKIIAVAAAKA